MQTSITLSNFAALFTIMLVGASIPSVSSLTVSSRSASFGFMHGVAVSIGIMVGDIVFILLAIFGLAVLAETMGSLFVLIKYIGGVYLIWLGIALWRSSAKQLETEASIESSLFSSFMSGFVITIADQKAILFYFGFFPAFLDITTVTYLDVGIIIAMAVMTIGAAKLTYAFLASRAASQIKKSGAFKILNIFAGIVMIAVGLFMLIRD